MCRVLLSEQLTDYMGWHGTPFLVVSCLFTRHTGKSWLVIMLHSSMPVRKPHRLHFLLPYRLTRITIANFGAALLGFHSLLHPCVVP